MESSAIIIDEGQELIEPDVAFENDNMEEEEGEFTVDTSQFLGEDEEKIDKSGEDSTDIPPIGDNEELVDEKSGDEILVVKQELNGSQLDGPLDLYIGMEFESDEAAKLYYSAYAKNLGFTTRARTFYRSKRDGTITFRHFVCSKGFRAKKGTPHEGKRQPNAMKTEGCKAFMSIKKQASGKWVVVKIFDEHNHALVISKKMHSLRTRKNLFGVSKNQSNSIPKKVPSGVMQMSIEDSCATNNLGSVDQDSKFLVQGGRLKNFGINIQIVLDYFNHKQAQNPAFYYAIQVDDDQRVSNFFWVDARSRMSYSYFGDVVIFDRTYKLNPCRLPLALFIGVNHHGQHVLFGCGILLNESESSFVWLFKTWLSAMHGRHPISMIIDQDKAIVAAITQIFPKTRYRFCLWDIFRESQEVLSHVYTTHPLFQEDFHNCINLSVTIEEFESSWQSLLDRYGLGRNKWFHSLYDIRQEWVPAYLRDTFFAEMCIAQPSEHLNSFFNRCVNSQTIIQVFKDYERALDWSYEREVEADFHTIYTAPVLKTPSPMEKQVANLYTRKIFAKFQEELVETFVFTANKVEDDGVISTYRVAKFDEDHKPFIVTFDISETNINCTCKMFEFSGILCRHIFTTFAVTNVLKIPSQYIVKRWTRNAKSGIIINNRPIELQGNCRRSLTLRYNNIFYEAIKYAEEGAAFIDIYNTAMSALKEGLEKVSSTKTNFVRDVQLGSVPRSNSQEEAFHRSLFSATDMTSSPWSSQDEAAFRFDGNNLVGHTPTIADLNLPPTTTHLPYSQDGGSSDNQTMLPRLKSMTWNMENQNSSPADRAAIINMKLQDFSKTPKETEVKFQLSKDTLEATLRSMAYISEQLSTPANKVVVINLKLPDYSRNPPGETELKFQVSRDTLEALLRSMAYIQEQLSKVSSPSQPIPKNQLQ